MMMMATVGDNEDRMWWKVRRVVVMVFLGGVEWFDFFFWFCLLFFYGIELLQVPLLFLVFVLVILFLNEQCCSVLYFHE